MHFQSSVTAFIKRFIDLGTLLTLRTCDHACFNDGRLFLKSRNPYFFSSSGMIQSALILKTQMGPLY
jgi:hypothetical protein